MEPHTTDTQLSRSFISDNADLWATIDIIRNHNGNDMSAMTDDGWADALGYDETRLRKIASSVKCRRPLDRAAMINS